MIRRFSAAVLVAALALSPVAAIAQEAARVPTLGVTATGTVGAPPDTAVVTLGVVTEADTAGPALTENNERMSELIDAFMAAGVADRDIGTSGFSVEPVMSFPPPREDGSQPAPRITGYRVSNNVTVKIREIAMAGNLLDQVVRIGANQVQGISFSVENDEDLLDQARREAIRSAKAMADVYAEAGGFELGRILLVREGFDRPEPFDMPMARMSAESVPLAPGEREFSVTVSVEWEIRQAP